MRKTETRENPRDRYKPDALTRGDVTVSGSLIDTFLLCQSFEYDRGCVLNERTHRICRNSPLHHEVFLGYKPGRLSQTQSGSCNLNYGQHRRRDHRR